MDPKLKKIAVILSVSSDIGLYLAKKYLEDNYHVVGTYRSKENIQGIEDHPDCTLFPCDINKKEDLIAFLDEFKKTGLRWNVFISAIGLPLPLQSFFEGNFDDWSQSVHVNAIEQLRALHMLYPFRNKSGSVDVVYFAGIASNGVVPNFSAYGIAKIMLTKMCEFLDCENKDMNVFIVGPGRTKTKNHYVILNDKFVSKEKYLETKDFMENEEGTSLDDIFACIEWLRREGREVSGGRNFSIVYDPWRPEQRQELVNKLKGDPNMYKLRRHNNNFLQPDISKDKKWQLKDS